MTSALMDTERRLVIVDLDQGIHLAAEKGENLQLDGINKWMAVKDTKVVFLTGHPSDRAATILDNAGVQSPVIYSGRKAQLLPYVLNDHPKATYIVIADNPSPVFNVDGFKIGVDEPDVDVNVESYEDLNFVLQRFVPILARAVETRGTSTYAPVRESQEGPVLARGLEL